MGAGIGAERAALGELRFAALERLLVKLRRLQVPVERLELAEAELLGAMSLVAMTDILHWVSPEEHMSDGRVPPDRRLETPGTAGPVFKNLAVFKTRRTPAQVIQST